MITLLSAIALGTLPAQIVDEAKVKNLVIEKIFYDGHTYLHFQNTQNYWDHKFFHDPKCHCRLSVVNELNEKLKHYHKENKESE